MEYLNKTSAKVYDHTTEAQVVVLEWGTDFITLEEGKEAVNAVLQSVLTHQKTKLLALINAEGFEVSFLDWLVASWYAPAYQAGLTKIAHLMAGNPAGNLSAEIVSWEDTSGIVFKNIYESNEVEAVAWLKTS
ncbi:MAG: hypothetical protein EAY75_01345 [Bacteroidetes bacterium]|nr:MAG: hypothetical protein EAY75_01345 [Bacteroidota bacterium]